jgi:L-rhamnose mutarotase
MNDVCVTHRFRWERLRFKGFAWLINITDKETSKYLTEFDRRSEEMAEIGKGSSVTLYCIFFEKRVQMLALK